MSRNWEALYALQDAVLVFLSRADHGFYLSGETALSRGYYNHRYSDDLDFFANDKPEFELWRDRCIEAICRRAEESDLKIEILLRDSRFGRIVVHGTEPLKIEFINDVPCRIGDPWLHSRLGRLDTRENILANKITALVDREAPKDIADIFWLCCRDGLSIKTALEGAEGKAIGLFPPVIAKALERGMNLGVPQVFWMEDPPPLDEFRRGLEGIIQQIME